MASAIDPTGVLHPPAGVMDIAGQGLSCLVFQRCDTQLGVDLFESTQPIALRNKIPESPPENQVLEDPDVGNRQPRFD